MVLRPYLTTYVNLCWVLGALIASGVLRGFFEREDQWSHKIPLILEWAWPVPLLVGAFFAPESPWWLVRKGREQAARDALLSLTTKISAIPFNVDDQVEMIKVLTKSVVTLCAERLHRSRQPTSSKQE